MYADRRYNIERVYRSILFIILVSNKKHFSDFDKAAM